MPINRHTTDASGDGSGETTQMIRALLQGLQKKRFRIDQIAVITLNHNMVRAIKNALAVQFQNQLKADAQWTIESCGDLDGVFIGTLESLCERILRARPVEAGINPNFKVLKGPQHKAFFKSVYAQWLDRMLRTDFELLKTIYIEYQMPLKNSDKEVYETSLEDLCMTALQHRELALAHSHAKGPIAGLLDSFAAQCKELRSQVENSALRQWMLEYITALRTNAALTQMTPAIQNFSPGNKGGAACKEVRGQWKAVCQRYIRRLDFALAHADIQRLYNQTDHMLANFRDFYQKALFQQGLLDREEVLYRVEQLLANHPKVRAHFKNQFTYLFIHAFEDVNPVQLRILLYLAEKKGDTARNHETVAVEHGKLSIVRNPLQALGRSHGKSHEAAIARFVGGESEENPVVNYRFSQPPPWLLPVLQGGDHSLAVNQQKDDQNKPAGVVIRVEPNPDPGTRLDPQSARKIEAQLAAAWIQKTLARGRYSHADILALFQEDSNLHRTASYLEALEIPYQIVGGYSNFRPREVIDIANVLNALICPRDQATLVAVLKGPLYALSDRQLYKWKLQKNDFDYRQVDKNSEHAVGRALNELKYLREQTRSVQAGVLIQNLLTDKHLLASYQAAFQGSQKLTNLMKTVEILKSFGQLPFYEIASRFNQLIGEPSAMSGFTSFTTDSGQVRLAAIHQAKGLKSKVVYLADSASPCEKIRDRFWDMRRERIIYPIGKHETPEYQDWRDVDRVERQAERARLRYIAAACVGDALVINKLPLELSPQALAIPFHCVEPIKREIIALSDFAFQPDQPEQAFEPREESRLKIEWEYIQTALTHARTKIAAPSIQVENAVTASASTGDKHAQVSRPLNVMESEFGSFSQMTIGSLVNKLLANHSTDPATAAKTLIADAGSRIERCALVKIFESLKKNALQKRIDDADAVMREVPIKCQNKDGVYLDGVIDLLFKEAGKWVLVDYQAIRLNPQDHCDKADRHHRERMARYVRGLRQMGIHVKESILALP